MNLETKDPLIKISDLHVIYNKDKTSEVKALENVSLEIYPHEYVIIFGPSGCGKSTLLYSIAALQKPTSGLVEVAGENIATYLKPQIVDYHRRRIGMIFQAFYLIPSLNVFDNIGLPKIFLGEDDRPARARIAELLERFSITDQQNKLPSALSGGQKQRVSIARALVNNPDIILADEPVGNLDSKSAYNVMSILKELNETDKKTVILVTHDPAHLPYGDKIVHMKDGKIIKVEIVREKTAPTESFIFKDGKIKEELLESGLVKEQFVPQDLRLLMKAFQGLSLAQIEALIIPFKVEQLFSHVFLSMTNKQIDTTKKRLEDYLYARIDSKKFQNELDKDEDLGGAELDRRTVESFSKKIDRLLSTAGQIDFVAIEKTATRLAEYLDATFTLRLNDGKKTRLAGAILDRLKNRIGLSEMQKILDISENRGGLGLDRRTSKKLARELELLLLLRYST